MLYFEPLLQKHFNHSNRLSQLHALIITTGYFLFKPHTTFTYNCLMKCHNGSALLIFTHMIAHSIQPNAHTFPSLLKSTSSLSTAQSVHSQILSRGLLLDSFTNCCLVDAYARFSLLNEAKATFDNLRQPDAASCNSILHAFCINNDVVSALDLFLAMPERNIVSWTTVINGLANHGLLYEAIDIFIRLMCRQQVVRPNEATLVSALSVCANLELCHGKEIHAYIVRSKCELTAFLATGLIDFYGKHGRLNSLTSVFDLVEKKEVCTWNAMISSLACNGEEEGAIRLFNKMRAEISLHPDQVTFVAVLTACARRRLVSLGLSFFDSMHGEFGIVPSMEHYGCIVDLLSRAGMLKEAWEFIKKMPTEPDSSVLGSLLGACKVHEDAATGADVGRKVMELQPSHSCRYMVMANIFAQDGKWDAAERLREGMEKAGVQKIVGRSRLYSANCWVYG